LHTVEEDVRPLETIHLPRTGDRIDVVHELAWMEQCAAYIDQDDGEIAQHLTMGAPRRDACGNPCGIAYTVRE